MKRGRVLLALLVVGCGGPSFVALDAPAPGAIDAGADEVDAELVDGARGGLVDVTIPDVAQPGDASAAPVDAGGAPDAEPDSAPPMDASPLSPLPLLCFTTAGIYPVCGSPLDVTVYCGEAGAMVPWACILDGGSPPCAAPSPCTRTDALGATSYGATTHNCTSGAADCAGFPVNSSTGAPVCSRDYSSTDAGLFCEP